MNFQAFYRRMKRIIVKIGIRIEGFNGFYEFITKPLNPLFMDCRQGHGPCYRQRYIKLLHVWRYDGSSVLEVNFLHT